MLFQAFKSYDGMISFYPVGRPNLDEWLTNMGVEKIGEPVWLDVPEGKA